MKTTSIFFAAILFCGFTATAQVERETETKIKTSPTETKIKTEHKQTIETDQNDPERSKAGRAANKVGHATKEGAKAVGSTAKKGGKKVGKGAKKAGSAVGKGAKKGAREVVEHTPGTDAREEHKAEEAAQ